MYTKNFSNLTIFTSTLYKDDEISQVRLELCLKLLRNAHDLGVRVVMQDGGSSEQFLKKAMTFENVVVLNESSGEKTMGADRRLALKKAMEISEKEQIDNPCYLWTEPEKDGLITSENLHAMMQEIASGANIVIPSRQENAWNSLNKNQRWFEQRANNRAHQLIGEEKTSETLDLWFGPKMFDNSGAEDFVDYNQDKTHLDLWDATIVPVAESIKEGKKVQGVPIDYEYSEAQRVNESGILKEVFALKRLEQYAQILRELGDKKWVDFFEENKRELSELREINKNPKESASDSEIASRKDELKKHITRSFFNRR